MASIRTRPGTGSSPPGSGPTSGLSSDGSGVRARSGPARMMGRLGVAEVGLLAALGGACAGPGRPASRAAEPASPLVVPLGAAAGGRQVAERARGAEVVYLGELHDNPAIHVAQAAIVRAMVADGARPTLAFEMIPEGSQD